MRLAIVTNLLISALLVQGSLPAHLIALWREGTFDLLTAAEQLDELMRVTRYPKIRERLTPALAGRLINEVRDLAVFVASLPEVTACADPYDNYLLGLANAGCIVTVRNFLTQTHGCHDRPSCASRSARRQGYEAAHGDGAAR